jgi:Ca2+-binding EF-hand superfamily protein
LKAQVPGADSSDLEKVAQKLQELASKNGDICQYEFVDSVNVLRRKSARYAKKNFGFGYKEVEDLRRVFQSYDVNHHGTLSDREIQSFFESKYAGIASLPENRPELAEVMLQSPVEGAIDFRTFLRLASKCQELFDRRKMLREREAVAQVKFTPYQVKEFREIFMEFDKSDCEAVTLNEMMELLAQLVPMGTKNKDAITQVFKEVVCSKNEAEFPDFLMILRRMLDLDICSINDYARVAAARDPTGHQSPFDDGDTRYCAPMRRLGLVGDSNLT